jgi:hypothetical protein
MRSVRRFFSGRRSSSDFSDGKGLTGAAAPRRGKAGPAGLWPAGSCGGEAPHDFFSGTGKTGPAHEEYSAARGFARRLWGRCAQGKESPWERKKRKFRFYGECFVKHSRSGSRGDTKSQHVATREQKRQYYPPRLPAEQPVCL